MIEIEIYDQTPVLEFDLGCEIAVVDGDGRLPDYDGPYEAIPKAHPQTLETKDKSMKDNVTVAEIPYHEVSNETGTTVVIGGIL